MNIQKRKKNKFLFMSIFIFLILLALYFLPIKKNKNDSLDIDYAKKMINDIKHLRISIDEYYLKTGEFPDLALSGAKDDLSLIKFEIEGDKKINFSDIYGFKELAETPEYKNLEASNQIYEVKDFKKLDEENMNGGWNYNRKTGEVHANLPSNFFNQDIEWKSF